MASSPRITVLLSLSAVALWRCIGAAPAYGQKIQSSGHTTKPYLFRAFSPQEDSVMPSMESLPLAPAAQDSHSETLKRRNDVGSKTAQGRSDHFTDHANKWSIPPAGERESGAITTLPPEENLHSLQWHRLVVYTPTLRAHAGKALAGLTQAYNLSGMMSPSSSPSAVVDAMHARRWQPRSVMKAPQPPRSAGTPVSDHKGGAVSDLQPREEASENSARQDFVLSDMLRAPLKKKKQLRQKHEENSAEHWPLLTPAHAVDGLLRYPDDSEGRSDLPWDAPETQSVFSNVDDLSTSEYIQEAQDAKIEPEPAECSSERRPELGGQSQASTATAGENRPLNEGQNIMQEIHTNSAASVRVGLAHQPKVARQNKAQQGIIYGSLRHVDGRQNRTRQVRQREQSQQQGSTNGVGAATSRRLSSTFTAGWSDTAQHALQRLHAAQHDVASLLASSTLPFNKGADKPDTVKRPSHNKKSKRTHREHENDSSRSRTTRTKRSRRDHKDFSPKSLSAAYHRFLKQEAKAMNYRGDRWESFPLPHLAFFAVLALTGHPLLAVYCVSFVALDQLVQLDNMLEQHAVLHLRARRRLLKQFLRDLKKEHEDREEKKVTTSPEQPDENSTSGPRLDQGGYKYLNTDVVAALAPQDGRFDTR